MSTPRGSSPNRHSARTSHTTTNSGYGKVIPRVYASTITSSTPSPVSISTPSPISTSAASAVGLDIGGDRRSSQTSPHSPLDAVRDQVAQTIVLRALRDAELVDGTKIGVVFTLPHPSGEQFLQTIASHIKRVMLLKDPAAAGIAAPSTLTGTGSYLFILTLPTSTPGGLSPILVCASDDELAERAALLICSKLLTRVERQSTRHRRWAALVRGLCATPGSNDDAAFWDAARKAARAPIDPLVPPRGSRSIAQVLADARARLQRITPAQALAELQDDHSLWPIVLVDIRPEAQRQAHGEIAGALIVERNVLEWRFDPRCAHRLPIADRYDLRVIVFCQEGYTSSLAAAALHDLGMLNATDMIGGYAAWKDARLPDEIEVSSTAPPTEGRASVQA